MKQCIFWDHLYPGSMFIEKVPEWVVFCLECAAKINDEKEYKWDDEWRIIWKYLDYNNKILWD